jgi:hypothetical protein
MYSATDIGAVGNEPLGRNRHVVPNHDGLGQHLIERQLALLDEPQKLGRQLILRNYWDLV